MKWAQHLRTPFGMFSLLFLTALLLTACVVAGEYIWLSDRLDSAVQIPYKIALALTTPLWMCAAFFADPDIHHSLAFHGILVPMATPFFYWGVWKARNRLARRIQQNRQAPPLDKPAPSIGRRQFISKAATQTALVAAGGLAGYAFLIEPRLIAVREYEIPIQGLHPDLDGLKIVQISDTHFGPYVTMRYLESALERANRLEADLIALTGDYVHRRRRTIEPGIRAMGALKASLGIVAVLGNHDHYLGRESCKEQFQRLGVPLLDNNRLFLSRDGLESSPRHQRVLCLAGVGDLWEDTVSFQDALHGVDPEIPRLLLSHNPDVAENIPPGTRVDLMLSGHTHGGQVSLPLIPPVAPTDYGKKYLGGLCKGPSCPVIVSRGVGMTGFPVRFRVQPEIGLIRLKRAEESGPTA